MSERRVGRGFWSRKGTPEDTVDMKTVLQGERTNNSDKTREEGLESEPVIDLLRERMEAYAEPAEWPEDEVFSLTEAEEIIGKPIRVKGTFQRPQEMLLTRAHSGNEGGSNDTIATFLGYDYHPLYTDSFTMGGQSKLLTIAQRQRGEGDPDTTFMTDKHGHWVQKPHEQIVIKTIELNRHHRTQRALALREIVALSKKGALLDAKHVIQEDGTETYILALEQIPGKDLRHLYIETGPETGEIMVSPDEMIGLMKASVDVVRELKKTEESFGIRHRDIKPANIIYNREGKSGLCDWGLVEFNEQMQERDDLPDIDQMAIEEIERSGYIAGTPDYISPYVYDGRDDPNVDGCGLGLAMLKTLRVAKSHQRQQTMAENSTAAQNGTRMDIPKLTEENYKRELLYWSKSPADQLYVYIMSRLGQPRANLEEYDPRPFEGGYDEVISLLLKAKQMKEEEVARMSEDERSRRPVKERRQRTTPGATLPVAPIGDQTLELPRRLPPERSEVKSRLQPKALLGLGDDDFGLGAEEPTVRVDTKIGDDDNKSKGPEPTE